MNLSKLFDMQKALDERIVKEKGLEGKDLLPMKILALQVELGELANEWRGFKFWSKNQEPTTERDLSCGCPRCEGCQEPGNPLLEEYVDCLHFILSIGNDLHHYSDKNHIDYDKTENDTLWHFHCMIRTFSDLWDYGQIDEPYGLIIKTFIDLGELLGFTQEQIEAAYMDKNKVNHERQENGY